MNKLLPIVVAVVSAGGLAASGCTVNSTTNNNGNDAGTDAYIGDDGGVDTGTTGDDGGDAAVDSPEEAATPVVNVRLADWSPDAPTGGYDVCLAPHGTTNWVGPILASIAGDAGTFSLGFPTVTTYIQFTPPGAYDLEIEAVGSDCTATAVNTTAIANLDLSTADGFYTLALVGDSTAAGSDPAITAIALGDDVAPTGGTANVRFLNVAPSLNGATTVDFGTGALGASSFSALETGITFAALATAGDSDAGAVDPNGYVSVAAFTAATEFSGHVTGQTTTDTATASGQMIAGNTSATLVLINGKTGGSAASFLVCQGDTTTGQVDNLSSCTQVAH
jgi:hypothetical protein